MNIKRIIIKNLYGYLNKDIEFNKNINLLVGINGSGKTSVLNIINWLLVPSLSNLCANEFDKIELHFNYKNEDYILINRQNEKELTIDLDNISKNYSYPQIQADFNVHPKKLTKNIVIREQQNFDYKHLRPEPHEVETWEFLFSQLPNPIVIGLDRNLFTEEGEDISYIEDDNGRFRKRVVNQKKVASPLDKVMSLSGMEYMSYKNKILDLNKRLNDKIMLSSFEETLTLENLHELLESPKIPLKQVELLEIKVKDYFEENVIDKRTNSTVRKNQQAEALSKIERYFSNLKSILNQVNKKDKEKSLDILYITNVNQFRKIKELIKEFEDFENKSKRFFVSLKQYLDTVNLFLKDSAKEIYFDKRTSKLKFRILNKNSKIIQDNREIENLSSGEKQILILFTYIKFNNKLGKLFIIDEPELSLHPKWQENFLEGIKTIMPSNTQLLFATHSPSIVAKNKEYCTVLLPY
ncbi:ATP-binding protein [Polaribacter sp. AHE13PA]|uniref:ATP-binding protein n=1 Tax=Polaribacter sp. AHE13PA TaxID=2745562 RepID=UPI001C4E4650|nr:ATP-binding protein [Polaribacter sp. AHE13PA]QXP65835.1 AAA family ATPase [Polaribacter sp. AHE13PA]